MEGANACVEHALAALGLDVVGRVAGHRSDDFHPLFGEEFGHPLVTGLFDDGGVEAIHHAPRLVEAAHALHQPTKIKHHLRRASG